jgi:protein-S-isoprenylcysteine O-methyltransferase Ste14
MMGCGGAVYARVASRSRATMRSRDISDLAVVFLEEPDLRRKFGSSYEDYRRAVPRWLPRTPAQ